MKFLTFFTKTAILVSLATNESLAQINNPAPYCDCTYALNYEVFKSVNINGTVVNSFGNSTGPSSPVPFRYFNNVATNSVAKGAEFPLSITFPNVNAAEVQYFSVYIDFNGNNVFDASERVMHNDNTLNASLPVWNLSGPEVMVTKNIMVPANAVSGTTRMRIIRAQNDDEPMDPEFTSGVVVQPCRTENDPWGHGGAIDFNLNISTGSTAQIDEESSMFTLFPNPAKEELFLATNFPDFTVSIISLSGAILLQQDNVSTINLSEYPAGIYFIEVSDNSNGLVRQRQKFSKL